MCIQQIPDCLKTAFVLYFSQQRQRDKSWNVSVMHTRRARNQLLPPRCVMLPTLLPWHLTLGVPPSTSSTSSSSSSSHSSTAIKVVLIVPLSLFVFSLLSLSDVWSWGICSQKLNQFGFSSLRWNHGSKNTLTHTSTDWADGDVCCSWVCVNINDRVLKWEVQWIPDVMKELHGSSKTFDQPVGLEKGCYSKQKHKLNTWWWTKMCSCCEFYWL